MKRQLQEAAAGWRAMTDALSAEPYVEFAAKAKPQVSVRTWPDPQLIAAIRLDPLNPAALDELTNRYWKQLFARCRLLTVDPKKAADLAHETWRHVLRQRHALQPGNDFSALLITTAISLWQVRRPTSEHAESATEERLASLESARPNGQAQPGNLLAGTFNLNTLSSQDQQLLATRIDNALVRLAPAQREVLLAHVIAGEPCAQIARRQQSGPTINGWLSKAMRELEQLLQQQVKNRSCSS